jgi:Damage-control phosphatase ARMT1-like domain
VINLKGHPTFVSDALSADMLWMIEHLSSLHADSRYTAVAAVGKRWSHLIASGKWVLQQDLFWAQPRPFWEVPVH